MNKKAEDSLKILKDGNLRYAEGKAVHPRQDKTRLEEIAPKQEPFAVVVSCSDSRVPPEIIFDQGLGDLFVIRVAGNVLDDIGIGSVEYAAEHLHVPLVVVLGHKNCGAVMAAVGGGEAPGHIKAIVSAITPAVQAAKKTCQEGDIVDPVVRANIRGTVKALETSSPVLDHLVKSGKLSIAGAYYDIDNGKVEF